MRNVTTVSNTVLQNSNLRVKLKYSYQKKKKNVKIETGNESHVKGKTLLVASSKFWSIFM